MEPLAVVLSDTPIKDNLRARTEEIIPASTFKDTDMNRGMTRAGSFLIFVSVGFHYKGTFATSRSNSDFLSRIVQQKIQRYMAQPIRIVADSQAGSCLVALSLIFGVIRARIFFLIAAATAGLGALLLLV